MSSQNDFAAKILETSAPGFAGLTASLLFERHPEIEGRYEGDGFSNWKAQLQRWLVDLSAAVGAGEPRLFEARMVWTRKVFASRGANAEDLAGALEALRDTLNDRLPEKTAPLVVPAVERAIEAVASTGDTTKGLVHGPPVGADALTYLEGILDGRPREAVANLLATVDEGTSPRDIYLDVLIPAQRETGRMWHAGELSVGEEHLITTTTQRAMTLLAERAKPAESVGKTVLLACVAGNIHDIGIRAISDFYEMAGWKSINLGPDLPYGEIARAVQSFEPDVLILAATLDPHVKEVQRSIERVRALEDRDPKIIVGGPVFVQVPDLWKTLGADGHAAGVEDAEPLGSELTSRP